MNNSRVSYTRENSLTYSDLIVCILPKSNRSKMSRMKIYATMKGLPYHHHFPKNVAGHQWTLEWKFNILVSTGYKKHGGNFSSSKSKNQQNKRYQMAA